MSKANAGARGSALRHFIGHNGRFTAQEVADATVKLQQRDPERFAACSVRGIEGYLAGENQPYGHRFNALCACLGAEYVNLWLAEIGMGGVYELLSRPPETAEMMAVLSNVMALLATANMDGHVDHMERAAILPQANMAVVMLNRWLRAA